MNFKENKRLTISLGLIVVLLVYIVFAGRDKTADLPDLKEWDKTEEITISKTDKTVKINKKDGAWTVGEENYQADKTKADKLETEMKELKITDVVSKTKFYEKYDLTPETAAKVTVKGDGKIVRDLLLGKKSPTNRSTYIKIADKDEVYLASGSLIDEFNVDVEGLRDKDIYDFSKDNLSSIELTYKGQKLTFNKGTISVPQPASAGNEKDKKKDDKVTAPKTEDKWTCVESKNTVLDKNKMDALVRDFSKIQADSFSDVKKDTLKQTVCVVKTKIADKEVELRIHKEFESGKYICTSPQSPYAFFVRDWKAKQFFKSLKDFEEQKKK